MQNEVAGIVATESRWARVQFDSGLIRAVAFDCADADYAGGTFLCPGFLDIQVNGLAGTEFNDPGLTT